MPLARKSLQPFDNATRPNTSNKPRIPKSFSYEEKENIPFNCQDIVKNFTQKNDLPPKSTPNGSINIAHWDAHLKFNELSPITWPFNTPPSSELPHPSRTPDFGSFDSFQGIPDTGKTASFGMLKMHRSYLQHITPIKILIDSPETSAEGFENLPRVNETETPDSKSTNKESIPSIPQENSASSPQIFIDSPQSDKNGSNLSDNVFENSVDKDTVNKPKSSNRSKSGKSSKTKGLKHEKVPFKIYEDPSEEPESSIKEPSVPLTRNLALQERPQNRLKEFLTPKVKKKPSNKGGVKLAQSITETCFATPTGKKVINFDTPLQNKIRASGLHGMSPSTIKQTQQLGKGKFGNVIVGKYKGKKRAMKISKMANPTMMTKEAWAIQLDHPNIIQTVDVHDTNDNSDFVMIVMEFVGEDTLHTYLERSELLPLNVCVKFSTQISDALAYCHQKNIIHMDVKPTNIVVTPSSICKLTDFGCCINTRETRENDLNDCLVVGTVPYTAPEIFKGQFPTYKADVYSLSIVMWQLWANRAPYSEIRVSEIIIYKVVGEGKRPDSVRKPKTSPEKKYFNLFNQGWKASIDSRPTSQQMFSNCRKLSVKS